ncbi:MAG: glycosyltransferase family 39 protein [bacterium]|nr:glycosyltransferase family 39 protein [bacterium]
MGKKKKKVKKVNQAKQSNKGDLFKLVKNEYVIVGGILLLAIILRVVYLFQLKNNDPYFFTPHEGDDTYMYVTAAKEILDGTFPKAPFGYNPLYYYFLALCYSLTSGYNLIFPRIVQFTLGVVTCLLTYLIGKQVFNKNVGMIGALLCAVCGTLIFYEGVLLSTALTTFFSCACLFFFIRGKEKGITKHLILGAVCLGLATLSQPNTIVFLPFILVWMFITYKIPKKEIVIKYALVLLVFFITISPVTIRNCVYGGKFILLTTAGGFQFWIGNNEHATGVFDFCQPHLNKLQEKMKEEGKELYLTDVLNFAKRKPVKFIGLQVKKFLLFWGSWDIPHQTNYDIYRENFCPLLKLPFVVTFGGLAIIGLAGLFLSLGKFRRFLLLYLFIFVYSFSVVAVVVVGRYRPPVIPFLALLGGFTIYYFYEKFRFKEYKKSVLPYILLITFTGLVNSQFIIKKLRPIPPYGTYITTPKGFIIRDSSDEWHGGKSISLRDSSVVIKKEFFINEDISTIKESCLWLILCAKKTGSIIVKVNETEWFKIHCKEFFLSGGISAEGLLGKIGIGPIPLSLLKNGFNTFTLSSTEDAHLGIPVDNYYNYGRSYVSYDGEVEWEKVKGEYMVELEIKTKGKELTN